jgi:NAD dependent epimerase/dehydratase family enzyme
MAMVLGLGKNSVFRVLHRLVQVGLGGTMGSGRQFVSWIHQLDYCRAVEWLTTHKDIEGPVNLAAPEPIRNGEMMETLRRICGIPFGLAVANWMLEIGAFLMRTETELVIKSRRVIPGRLINSGFQFRFPTIEDAFENLCQTKKV